MPEGGIAMAARPTAGRLASRPGAVAAVLGADARGTSPEVTKRAAAGATRMPPVAMDERPAAGPRTIGDTATPALSRPKFTPP
mmetsp:Transcript_15686/g.28353  ORF Transcript_15686/g.28353 Transcript_15686/m.28353 type:complete len:83 (+) Transcript_15686:937-1185(+)